MNVHKLCIELEGSTLLDISFSISKNLALVGESGSGKSLTLKALLGMLPKSMSCNMKVESSFELIAGETLSLVPQNPFTALSPLTKIKKHFFSSSERVEELFTNLGLKKRLLSAYPLELSGGQLQRVVLAIALESRPKLLLLDEPTTALDPQSKELILDLLLSIQEKEGFKMLFVSHDFSTVIKVCEEICILKKGYLLESGSMQDLMSNPQNTYTKKLIEANFSNRKFRE